MRIPASVQKALEARRSAGALRSLPQSLEGVDFCSNDYLGFARDFGFRTEGCAASALGSTGSRLISGNSHAFEELEQRLAHFHQSPSALLFNSGYDANVGLLSSLAVRGVTILY